jgi:DNA-binding transcriptional regulator YiaG
VRIETADGAHHAGSPLEIVKDMRERDFRPSASVDAYMKRFSTQFKLGDIVGDTVEQRCESFLVRQLRARLVSGLYVADAPDSLDADAIRVMRRARELTIQKLANELGVSAMTINRWESGENAPDAERHEAIVRALFEPRYQIRPQGTAVARESAPPDDARTRVRDLYRIPKVTS